MKIASSEVQMASARSYTEENRSSADLRVWIGGRNSSGSSALSAVSAAASIADKVTISIKASLAGKSAVQGDAASATGSASVDADEAQGEDWRVHLVRLVVESLTGHKLKTASISTASTSSSSSATATAAANGASTQLSNGSPPPVGWGVRYAAQQSHYESETTTFAAQGIVRTSDGKEINFSVNLSMQREYRSESSVLLTAGDAKQVDPLVINFGGTAAELTDTKFAFDLNSDGTKENISFVGSGSGLLVLDKNGDGVINNGGELFGPGSGNGFSELAAYDADKNGWIDENDPVYSQLEVWTKDSQGADTLSSLKSMDVGAIYLSSVDTKFDLKDESNNLDGQVSSTGVYLEDSGGAKTVQQVNLTA